MRLKWPHPPHSCAHTPVPLMSRTRLISVLTRPYLKCTRHIHVTRPCLLCTRHILSRLTRPPAAFNVPTMNLNLTALSRRTMILTIQGAREEAEDIGSELASINKVPTVADNQATTTRRTLTSVSVLVRPVRCHCVLYIFHTFCCLLLFFPVRKLFTMEAAAGSRWIVIDLGVTMLVERQCGIPRTAGAAVARNLCALLGLVWWLGLSAAGFPRRC